MKTRGGPELVEVEVEIVHETERAWKVWDGSDRADDIWLPKQAVEFDERGFRNGRRWGVMSIPADLAIDKGLE